MRQDFKCEKFILLQALYFSFKTFNTFPEFKWEPIPHHYVTVIN